MNFLYVFRKMLELFLIIIIGYVCNKCGIFQKEARLHVTKLVLNVTMPAMILASVLNQDSLPDAGQILWLLAVAFSSYIVLLGAAYLLPGLLGVKEEEVGIYQFMIAFGNVGFIGFPVTQAIFGDGATFYTSVFNMPFNLLAYSFGVAFIRRSARKNTGEDGRGARVAFDPKLFLTPGMAASVLTILFALIRFKASAMIGETCAILGNITTPAALLIIGSSLAEMPIREMFSGGRIYLFALCRLLLLPLLMFAGYRLFVKDALLLGECIIIAAMPAATNGIMFCLQYGGEEKRMAQGIFLTTLASVVTIPLIAMLFV